MNRFLIIECDEHLNPSPPPANVPTFKGTHIFNSDEILRIAVTPLELGTRIVVVMKACKGTTICHTPALAGAVIAQLHGLTRK